VAPIDYEDHDIEQIVENRFFD